MGQIVTARMMPATRGAESLPQSGARSLRTNIASNLAGHGIYAGCQWGMLAVLAKLGSPEMVGVFALGLAITAPVFMFTNLHLQAVQRTDARRVYQIGDFLGLRLVTTALALLIVAGIVLAAGYRGDKALIILVIGLAKAVESISNALHGFFQQHERMDRVAQSLILKGLLSLGAMSAAVALTGDVLWGVVALVGAWVVTLIAFDLRSAGDIARLALTGLRPRWDRATSLGLARLAFPLGVATLLISLTVNVPRYAIERQLGARELGIFAAMAYLMVAADTVSMALGQSASPRLAAHYATGERSAYCSLLLKLVGLAVAGGAVAVLLVAVGGRQILTLLYTSEYGGQAGVFLWLMVAVGIGFVASILTYGITAARYYTVQAPLSGFVLLVTVAACALLIPRYGLTGAAIALIAAAVTNLCANALTLSRALARIDEQSVDGATVAAFAVQGQRIAPGETNARPIIR